MKKKTFAEELMEAKKNGCAVGAFNILNYCSAGAVVQAAEELNCSVILQTSVATVHQFGPDELGAMLCRFKQKASVNVLIHLDHCKDVELAKICVDEGWDSVMYDGSWLPLEQNIENCRRIVAYAHEKGVQVEGELGTIAGVEDDIQVKDGEEKKVRLEEAVYFVRESGIDVFAPAIGTAHGVYKGIPNINFELVRQLSSAVETPLVIHGGTGLAEEVFRQLICDGASKINVSTAIKHAYLDGCKAYFTENPNKVDPLGFDRFVSEQIKAVAKEHMMIFRQKL